MRQNNNDAQRNGWLKKFQPLGWHDGIARKVSACNTYIHYECWFMSHLSHFQSSSLGKVAEDNLSVFIPATPTGRSEVPGQYCPALADVVI